MKTHSFHFFQKRNLVFSLCLFSIFFGCKKEDLTPPQANNRINSSVNSNLVVSDGIITLQTSILPPATPQSFVANGSFALAEFQITASRHVFLYSGAFNATYPLILGVVTSNFWVNNNGVCGASDLGHDIYPNQGLTLEVEIVYNNVDSSNSGAVGKISINNLVYRTDDEYYHSFYPSKSIESPDICVVNNIPHIQFQNPANKVLANGYVEIADVQLSGDTDWTLNALPVFLSSFNTNIPNSKLIVRSGGAAIPTTSTAIQLEAGSTAQTVINFTGGFHHMAGKTEILRIFGKATGGKGVFTNLFPLTSFKWKDGLGVLISGAKNGKFFKEDTGQSVY